MTRFTKIAAGATEWKVWGLDESGHVWSLAASTKPGGFEWIKDTKGSDIKEFSVDGAGNLWTVNGSGMVHERLAGKGTAAEGVWERRPKALGTTAPAVKDKALGIAAGKSEIMMVDVGSVVHRWDGSKWANFGGSAVKDICSGGQGVAYCINTSGQVYKSKSSGWTTPETAKITGVKRLEVGFDNALMYLGSDNHVYHLATKTKDAKGAGVDLAVSNVNDVWVVNSTGEIWRRTDKPIAATKLVVKTDTTKVSGKSYTWSQIKGPA